jgi:hypothetical protein
VGWHREPSECNNIAHWLLFAGLQLPAGMPVLYEAAGGIVEPEKMIQAHVLRAWYHGAHVKTGEAVRAPAAALLSGHWA